MSFKNLTQEQAQKCADKLSWDYEGLIPCIIQDAGTKEILMPAFMNGESIDFNPANRRVMALA